MQPMPPQPYRAKPRTLVAAPLSYAQRVSMPDGALVATFVYGRLQSDSTPVLVLHGNGGTHFTFSAVVGRLLDAGLAVIAIDARSQGQSTRGSAPLTYEQMAQDAIAVLDALGVERAHILGHSDGGIEALLLARDHSDRVASIVAGGANLTPEGVIDEWDTKGSVQANRDWATWMEEGDLPANMDRTLLPSAEEALLDAELLQLMLDEPHIDPASLRVISCPACVLVGENDCIALEETNAIANSIPGARLVTVPNMGHSLPRMAPDAVALQVLTNVILAK